MFPSLTSVTCPNCGGSAQLVNWNGRCECDDCGHVWNKRGERKRQLAKKRQEYLRKLTPSNARLKELAANSPPPSEWFQGEEEDLFAKNS